MVHDGNRVKLIAILILFVYLLEGPGLAHSANVTEELENFKLPEIRDYNVDYIQGDINKPITFINQLRGDRGLSPLQLDTVLSSVLTEEFAEFFCQQSESLVVEYDDYREQLLKLSLPIISEYSLSFTMDDLVNNWQSLLDEIFFDPGLKKIGVISGYGNLGEENYTILMVSPFDEKSRKAMEDEVVQLVNQVRLEEGLNELVLDDRIRELSRMKAQDKADIGYVGHTSARYGTPDAMVKEYIPDLVWCGENLAHTQKSAFEVFEAWMNSPGHRAAIVREGAQHIGVGVVQKNGDHLYWSLIITRDP